MILVSGDWFRESGIRESGFGNMVSVIWLRKLVMGVWFWESG